MNFSYEEFDVYNMYFHQGVGFAIDDVEFRPWKKFWDEYDKTRSNPMSPTSAARELVWRDHHVKTGTARITLPGSEGSAREVQDEMEETLFDYRLLLSFAHGHHVFLQPGQVRKRQTGRFAVLSQNGGREHVWVGKILPEQGLGIAGLAPSNIRDNNIETFLRHSMAELKKGKDPTENTSQERIDLVQHVRAFPTFGF